jgi:hypothetical protein
MTEIGNIRRKEQKCIDVTHSRGSLQRRSAWQRSRAGPATADAATGTTKSAAAPRAAAMSITHINCEEQEDFNGKDDPYLVNEAGDTIWGPEQLGSGEDLDVPNAPVSSNEVVTLRESDFPDDDDTIGAVRIPGPGHYTFDNDDARYTITVS